MTEYYRDNTKGWICPKCGKVWSPCVEECIYCNDGGPCHIPERVGPYDPYDYPCTIGPPMYHWYTTY